MSLMRLYHVSRGWACPLSGVEYGPDAVFIEDSVEKGGIGDRPSGHSTVGTDHVDYNLTHLADFIIKRHPAHYGINTPLDLSVGRDSCPAAGLPGEMTA